MATAITVTKSNEALPEVVLGAATEDEVTVTNNSLKQVGRTLEFICNEEMEYRDAFGGSEFYRIPKDTPFRLVLQGKTTVFGLKSTVGGTVRCMVAE